MNIQVKLFAGFREGRFQEAPQEYPPGTDCRTIVQALGLTEGQIGTTPGCRRCWRTATPSPSFP